MDILTRPMVRHSLGNHFSTKLSRLEFFQRFRSTPDGARCPLGQCPQWVCAVTRRRFPVGASPTRQTLQPEATGAVMDVTKWLKPQVSLGPDTFITVERVFYTMPQCLWIQSASRSALQCRGPRRSVDA